MSMESMPTFGGDKENKKETEVIVFQGKRMRTTAEEMIARGESEAVWKTSRGEDTNLRLYIIPIEDFNEAYVDGFEKLFNHIKDESGKNGIFLGIRKEESPMEKDVPTV